MRDRFSPCRHLTPDHDRGALPHDLVERLRAAAQVRAGADKPLLWLAAAAEIERLRNARTEANNQWRLDYNDCAVERDRLRSGVERLRALVDEQAEDDGLWFIAQTAPEAYLQQELRRLHAEIEAFTHASSTRPEEE